MPSLQTDKSSRAEETNMRRWTDGRRWGASRVGGGGFLVYTEYVHAIA
jgi:hypothetical protein